jgi:hypothetical protein
MISRFFIALIALVSVNCAALDGYERRYGIAYYDEEGNKLEASVALVPVKPKVIRSSK